MAFFFFFPSPLLFKHYKNRKQRRKHLTGGEGEVSALYAHERKINHILFTVCIRVALWSSTNSEAGLCRFVQHLTLSSPQTHPAHTSASSEPSTDTLLPPADTHLWAPFAQHELSCPSCQLTAEKALGLSPRSSEPLFPFKSDRNLGMMPFEVGQH